MRVVSNTSPVSNLAIIGRLDLLRERYGRVHVPSAVSQELGRLSHPRGKARITAAIADGWLHVDSSTLSPLPLPVVLDAGESAAIALALGIKADVLLIDEKRGRTAARQLGLTVAGVLGELLHAKLKGNLPELSAEFQKLRTEAGFFIDAGIEQFMLSQAGE